MLKRGVYDYKDVARIISIYYSDPGRLLDYVSADMGEMVEKEEREEETEEAE